MTVDELIRHPALLETAVTKEIARRLASIDALTREAEDKLNKIDAMFAEKEAKMAAAGYRLDLVRLRREDGLA
jgi:hypothetical protein